MALADEARAIAGEAREMAGLMGEAMEQLGKLLQNEVELAKAEMSQKSPRREKALPFCWAPASSSFPFWWCC